MNYTYHNLPTVWVIDIDQGCSWAVKSQLSDVRVWSMVGELHFEYSKVKRWHHDNDDEQDLCCENFPSLHLNSSSVNFWPRHSILCLFGMENVCSLFMQLSLLSPFVNMILIIVSNKVSKVLPLYLPIPHRRVLRWTLPLNPGKKSSIIIVQGWIS